MSSIAVGQVGWGQTGEGALTPGEYIAVSMRSVCAPSTITVQPLAPHTQRAAITPDSAV